MVHFDFLSHILQKVSQVEQMIYLSPFSNYIQVLT